MTKDKQAFSLQAIIGKEYTDFWRFKGRYRVVKGSRASKKSKTAALNLITRMVEHPQANAMVIRKVFRTIKDSCFTELKWAIKRLNLEPYWHITESPLEMTYKPTKQKIYFRGMDSPYKVTSITVETGVLCWIWIEEAYELLNEADFNMIDESVRGAVPEGLFKQITLTFNPWNSRHWLKKRFFDVESSDILAKTTNYLCNEWLDDADRKIFDEMKKNNPRRYKVAGLGDWGIVEGLIYDNWREMPFNPRSDKFRANHLHVRSVFGLDFGYTNDPSALFCGLFDRDHKRIYVYDELYQTGLTNQAIGNLLHSMGYAKERIIADSAEPKSIDELRDFGIGRIRGARKGRDSVANGIQFIQNYKIIIHPRCVNFITEISNYSWEVDKTGRTLNKPSDNFNHLMDAMRYALEEELRGPLFGFE